MTQRRRRGTAIVDTPKGILVTSGKRKLFILPGGGANKGESRSKVAIRELREETGLKSKSCKFLFYHEGSKHKSHKGGHFKDYNKVFLIKTEGEARPRHEVKHIAYYKPGSKVNISHNTKLIIDKYLESKNKEISNTCDYHLCREKRILKECPYCKNHYCDEHIRPFKPKLGIGHPKEFEGGHPCFQYARHLDQKREDEKDKYSQALNTLLEKRDDGEIENKEDTSSPLIRKEITHNKKRHHLSYYWYHYKKYFFIALLLLLIIFSYIHREEISNKIKPYYDSIKNYYEKHLSNGSNEENNKYTVTLKTVNELVNSHISCLDLDHDQWPIKCSEICKSVSGEYIDDICTGDKEIYCKCKIEIKEYITEKKDEPKEESPGFSDKIAEVFQTEPISDKTKTIEKLVLKYTNEERANNGVKELQWDDELADIAREHSLDMSENDFFSHVNLDGEDPTARAIRNGYPVHKELGGGWYTEGIGENIGSMPTGNVIGVGYVSSNSDSIAKALVDSWMESPGHRENILDGQYDKLGVGVAYDGTYYISTQDFF